MNTAALISQMSDQERELHIQHCGYLMEQAMLAGNRQEAMDWMQAETQAIGQRSPAQVARMEAEEEEECRLDEGLDYFSEAGQQLVKDIKTLDRIEQQREQAFDAPGVGRGAA